MLLIYTDMGVSVCWPLCVLCVFVCMCVISNQNTSKKWCPALDTSKLTPFCIKHTTRSLWYKDNKAWHVMSHIRWCDAITHSVKETRQQKELGGLDKIWEGVGGGSRNLLPTMNISSLICFNLLDMWIKIWRWYLKWKDIKIREV